MINTIQYLPGVGSSDHVCLQFELSSYSASSKASLPDIIYTKLILIITKRDLIEDVNWEDILSPLNIHCAWKLFTKKFIAFIDECIPQEFLERRIFS